MREYLYPDLRAEMSRHGDTQKTLAELFNLTAPSINKRFSGKVDWKIGEMKFLCRRYDKTFDELFL